MKAVNFLEWFKSLFTDPRSIYRLSGKQIERIFEVANFYSQPFRPEMITELFEGWKQSTSLRHYKNRKFEIICDGERTAYYTPNVTVNKQPPTLNDFISDCQRAGIELTFKKEIEDKLC